MRTFALLAFLAAYASGTELKGDDATADTTDASKAVDDALAEASKDAEAAIDAADDATEKGEEVAETVTNEELAASIDGALAQADENGEQKKEKNP